MDLITHLPHVSAGYTLVCTIVDQLSKHVYFVPCTEIVYTEGLSQLLLYATMSGHEMPHRIISDLYPIFTS